MLPTTCAKTSKDAQIQLKQGAAQYSHLQKVQMVENVENVVQQYSTSVGKSQDVARRELFTIDCLSRRKRNLCARDVFFSDKMHEINKGTYMSSFHLYCTMISLSSQASDKPKGERINLMEARRIFEFDKDFVALPQEEIAGLQHRAEEKQHNKMYVPKQVKHAQQHDVARVVGSFQKAVSTKISTTCGTNIFKLEALHSRTGHYGICVIVRGDPSMNADPLVAQTGPVSGFLEEITQKSLGQLTRELDALCSKGLKGFYFILFLVRYKSYLICTGVAENKKSVQECKKYCRNQLKLELRQ